MTIDMQVRLAAFNWLQEQVNRHGDVLPRDLLVEGFIHARERIALMSPQGIHKPRLLDIPLSITTSPNGPYNDAVGSDNLLHYRYRGVEPEHRDNVGLRTAMTRNLPLIYFHGLAPSRYLACWPVYIVGDNPLDLTFTVAVDDPAGLKPDVEHVADDRAEARRAYITVTVRHRIHQRSFREKVLAAYRSQCSLCRLRHPDLLDAAHIVPDSHPDGEPIVRNGIALCKLHHAAYDKLFIGISPDYVVQVREDILVEEDGPMLQHGLKELHRQRIHLPRHMEDRPDRDLLDIRFLLFQKG